MYEFRPPAVVRADAELTVAFRAADDDAIRALVDRYGGLVQAITSQTPGLEGPDAADEITVRTFLQAWRNAEVFEPGRPFGPWLANLAARVAGSPADPQERDEQLAALLADRAGWVEPRADLADRVVAAILAESTVGPGELYTADDLRAAQESARGGRAVRPFVIGAIAALVVLVLGVMVFSALGGASEPVGDTIELRPTGRLAEVSGTIEVTVDGDDLRILLDAPDLTSLGVGQWYEAWIELADGSFRTAGTFGTGDGIELSAAVAGGAATQFLVVIADDDLTSFEDRDVVVRAPLA